MNNVDKLVEQHIHQYISHLKHIDELMDEAHGHSSKLESDAESRDELQELRKQRDDFADYIESLKEKSPQQLLQVAGPMVMWELIAQRLENIVEKIKS